MIATTGLSSPAEILRLLRWSHVIGLDLETTGLNPRTDRIRLLSISDGWEHLVMDCFEHDIRQIFPALSGKIVIAHNAAFDLGFLWNLGLTDLPQTICTMLTQQLLTAGDAGHGFGACSLSACVHHYLGLLLPKELQKSDWSGPLSDEQIEYSRRDAKLLIPLFWKMAPALKAAGLAQVADIENRALPAFVWMSQSGVPFDCQAWLRLANQASAEKQELARALDDKAPLRGMAGLFGAVETWNWDSPKQVAEVLGLAGFEVSTTDDAQLALIPGDLAQLVRSYREQATLLKMYGPNWFKSASEYGGRVFPSWVQLGAASGRTTCKKPNMQQIPRRGAYRACVRASPGKILVKADYATLQMRIAAKWAKDTALLEIFQADGDPHTATAKLLLGTDTPSEADRQIAKSANFGLLFGMSSEGLRVYSKTTWGVDLTPEQVQHYRTRWFTGYSGLARWHANTKRAHVSETRSTAGRRRRLPSNAPDTWRLNSPVQGDEADGLKRALALLWERRTECPSAVPILAVHDEIVIEVDADQAESAKAWLIRAMEDGMRPSLDPMPVRVDAKIRSTWGG